MNIFKTRLILWKKQWLPLLFWLIFPLLITFIFIKLVTTVSEDTRIPISIVLEEESPIALEFKNDVAESPLVRLVDLEEDVALNELKKHNLDSVFIVDADFDQFIKDNRRVSMIDGYQSDLSFAYLPVKELLLSHLQKQSGRSKMVHFIHDMSDAFSPHTNWKRNELVDKATAIESEENLLNTSLTYFDQKTSENADHELINPWGIWALASILATFFIFDWLIKEKHAKATVRLMFTRYSQKQYVFKNFLIYMILLTIVDLITIPIMNGLTEDSDTFLSVAFNLLYFRFIICVLAFIVGLLIRKLYTYYSLSFIMVLCFTLTSGAILPIETILSNYDWLYYVNPVQAFIHHDHRLYWPILLVIFIMIWLLKKERSYASR